jgi:hypothetical protein
VDAVDLSSLLFPFSSAKFHISTDMYSRSSGCRDMRRALHAFGLFGVPGSHFVGSYTTTTTTTTTITTIETGVYFALAFNMIKVLRETNLTFFPF